MAVSGKVMFRTKRTDKRDFEIESLLDDDLCALCGNIPKQIEGLVYGLCESDIAFLKTQKAKGYRMNKTICIERWGLIFQDERVKLPDAIANQWLEFDWIKKESWLQSIVGIFV